MRKDVPARYSVIVHLKPKPGLVGPDGPDDEGAASTDRAEHARDVESQPNVSNSCQRVAIESTGPDHRQISQRKRGMRKISEEREAGVRPGYANARGAFDLGGDTPLDLVNEQEGQDE